MGDTFQFSLNAIRFEDVRAEVVKFLTANGTYDAPLDFEGSNLAYIIDTMAYTTMMMSYMVSTVANDNFLDTTTLRKNAVSIAKTLGYKPKRIQASRMEGVFTYNPGDRFFDEESKLIIPASTIFMGSEDGYSWVNTEPITLLVNPKNPFELTSAADELHPRITLLQGVYKKFSVLGTGKSLQSFTIPSKFIDENNMKVSVYTTQHEEVSKVPWTLVRTFFDIQGDEIYFLEEDILNEGTPKIIFGNNIVGRAPSLTETIIVDYLETVGPAANGELDIDISGDLVLNKSFDIDSVDLSKLEFEPSAPSFGGQDYETLDSIKANAPRFFATAGRAVTGNDYDTLIKTEYSHLIDEVNVIGGNQLEPGNNNFLGNAYIAATPTTSSIKNQFLDSLQLYVNEGDEVRIISSLTTSGIIATNKYFLKPSYIYLDIIPKIEISSKISPTELKETEETAFDTLVDYFDEEFKGFEVPYRNSKVRSQVDAIENVISTDIDTNYGFILNRDSFYIDRESVFWLPVKFKRENGQVVKGLNNVPVTTNFIKKNEQIIKDYNANNQSIIDLIHITIIDQNNVEIEMVDNIWHGRDTSIDAKYTDRFWRITLEANIPLDPTVDPSGTLHKWNILINNEDNTGTLHIGTIHLTDTKQLIILENSDPNIKTYLNDIVEVNNDFDIIDADKLNNVPYTSIRFRRKFNKYNLLPELINHNMVGRTSIHGHLTHDNLDRYLFNNDVYKPEVLKISVIADTLTGNKSMYQETFSFDGSGTNHYTVSLTMVASSPTESEYNLYFNNTVKEERQKVATLTWDKTNNDLTDVSQFKFVTLSEEVNWLIDEGFQVEFLELDGNNNETYTAFEVTIDETGNFHVLATLNSAISSIKVDEKNLLGVFTYDPTSAQEKYEFFNFYTRTFRTTSDIDMPLTFEEDVNNSIVNVTWDENPLFQITKSVGMDYDFDTPINTTNLTFNDLGLRPDVIIEPTYFTILDDLGNTVRLEGYALYSYGIHHNTTLGFFEYETGKINFNIEILGNNNSPLDPTIDTATTHIRTYFNNYGILKDETKMDVITIIPDNEYEDIGGFVTVVGSQTDFDSIYTQTIRAKINPVISTQI